jgi:hypothetical protein
MKLFLLLICATAVMSADFDAALGFPKRTESQVFRDRVKANWLPDGKTFWYRLQTAPGKAEYILINSTTGIRKVAPSLKELGLPEKEAVHTSGMQIELRRTRRTGESSGLKFINKLGEDVDLFWINEEGKHHRYGSIKAESEREQHSFEGHVWLITSRTGEYLAIVEAEATVKTLIIDGKGLTEAEEQLKKPQQSGKSPDGSFTITSEADALSKRKVTIVESSPKEGLQPKTVIIDYIKPGDPLPKPQLVIAQADGKKIRVPRDLYENPFNTEGRIDVTWSPDSREFYFDYNQRGHQLYRILATNAKTGEVRVVVEETSKTFIDYTKKTWRHWLHSRDELIWMSERDGWCH